MIIGIGLDLIGVERIRGIYTRQGQRFLDRVYSAEEQAYCLSFRDPSERLAARWAGKEAAMKALGTGWAQGVKFTDIAVLPNASGAPVLTLRGAALARNAALQCNHAHVTLSHSDGMAIAVVILEKTR